VGIDRTISWRLPAETAIDERCRQNGVAIAAHPLPRRGRPDAAAMAKLDALVQPIAYASERTARVGAVLRARAAGGRRVSGLSWSGQWDGSGPTFVREDSRRDSGGTAAQVTVAWIAAVYGDAGLIELSNGVGPARHRI
jgi:hypothetical protein